MFHIVIYEWLMVWFSTSRWECCISSSIQIVQSYRDLIKFIFLKTCTSLNIVYIRETLGVNTAVITYGCYITQGYIYCHMFLIVCIDWLKVEQISWGFWRHEGDRAHSHLKFTDQQRHTKTTADAIQYYEWPRMILVLILCEIFYNL